VKLDVLCLKLSRVRKILFFISTLYLSLVDCYLKREKRSIPGAVLVEKDESLRLLKES
jgi:hypothetical protein